MASNILNSRRNLPADVHSVAGTIPLPTQFLSQCANLAGNLLGNRFRNLEKPGPFPGRLLSRAIWCSCCIWLLLPASLHAQGSGLFTGSGTTRGGTGGISGNLGGSGFGTMTGGASGASGLGGALGGATGGRGGAGGQGLGASGLGASGLGASGLGAAGNSGFVGRTSTGMAGNAQAGQGGNAGNAGLNTGRSGASNRQMNGQSQFGGSGSGSNQKTGSSIRPRQRVAFEFNSRTPAAVATVMSTRMVRIGEKNPALKQVGIQVIGDQIVLSGKVKTVDQSKLIENLLRLEPGVKSIRNDLEIEHPDTVQ
jgi:hypothetical protein